MKVGYEIGNDKKEINMTKMIRMLGLAKKAGYVIIGTDQVVNNIRKKNPCMVLIASYASANTKKRINNCCEHYDVEYAEINITTEDLAHIIGNRHGAVSVVAIIDTGFISVIKESL